MTHSTSADSRTQVSSGSVLHADVIVIGGGAAGMAAAKTLADAGVDIVVLEARERVGGRTWTTVDDGLEFESGGQWVSVGQDASLDMIADLGLETYPRYRDGNSVFVHSNGTSSTFDGDFPVAPATAEAIRDLIQRFSELVAEIDSATPWLHPRAAELDAISWRAWVESHASDEEARKIVTMFIADGMFTKPPQSISVLQAVHMASSAGGFAHLVDENLLLDLRVVGGLQAISTRIAAQLGDRVRTSSPVHRIDVTGSGVSVHAIDVTVHAPFAIVAIPPTLIQSIEFDPPLPPLRQQLLQHLSFGHVVKVQAFYETPFWRAQGLSGTAFGPYLPVHEAYDNTYAGSKLGCLVGFVSDVRADAFISMDDASRRETALSCLAAYFGEEARSPVTYVESSWASEPYTRGAYGVSFDIGGLSRYGAHMSTPIGRLHWAGSDIADLGYMHVDGAIRTGIEAAEQILQRRASGVVS